MNTPGKMNTNKFTIAMQLTKFYKLKMLMLSGLLLMSCFTALAQVPVPFGIRYQNTIKGDMTMIANNIVNRQSGGTGTSVPYSGNSANDDLTMRYIDIDTDPSTFSSSSATLSIPDIACSNIVYAGLYWSATYRYNSTNSSSGRATDFNVVKLKLPGAANYTNITGTVIFDGFTNPTFNNNSPYACYANVTTLLQGLTNANGVYTVANVRATQASLGGGTSGGWTMFIVYENPEMPGRYITSYDGFAAVNQGVGSVDVNYTGFITVPAPMPVYAKLAVSALEGDQQINGDQLRFKAASMPTFSNLSNTLNPNTNFFNSTITTLNATGVPVANTARVPNSSNTLGWDADIVSINPGVIPNNETAATLRMMSTQDQYYLFFNALQVDIIEPQVRIVKKVQDIAGNDITGQDVTLGNVLDYVLTFQNIGNDSAQNTIIRDVLPENTTFNSIILTGAPGVTYTYNPAIGEIVFTVPNNLVEMNDPAYSIRIRVQVVNSCAELTDACSNIIRNQAFATYRGVQNTNLITNDPSVAGVDACGLATDGPSNFLVNVDNCTFTRDEILCGATLQLSAGAGYASYAWYKENGAVDTYLGNTQNITVTTPGQYYVVNSPNPPCIGLTEYINVTLFGAGTPNPIAPFADEIAICPNDGEQLPYIFLCGVNDTRSIQTNILNAQSLIWEKLNEGSCAPVTVNGCANKNMSCTWTPVGTGANFVATEAGQYRLTVNYQNGGCFSRYYFNVYANLLSPQFTFQNIVCSNPGNITVTNVPAGYEYQLVNQATNTVVVAYQNNPSFTITTAGAYKVELRQQGVTNGCVFELPNIGIMNMVLDGNVIVENAGCSGKGSLTVQALNVGPQYYFSISGPSSETHGPVTDNNHLFANLNPGTYTVTITTDAGCSYTTTATIADLNTLTASAVVSQHISCSQGNIQVNAGAGQPPYVYAIWSYNGVLQNPTPADYQTSVIFDIPLGQQGNYIFIVKGSNGCTRLTNEVTINLEPDVQYTTSQQNLTCNGANNGSINFAITGQNGWNLSYVLQNGSGTTVATNTSGVFTGLAAGNYTVVLTQSKGSKSCSFTIPFTITQPPALAMTGAPAITHAYTCATTATIAVNPALVSGGTAPYSYSINGITFGASPSFTGLTAGTYTITIRDANGCTFATTPVTINPLPPLTNITFTATQVTCPTQTSNVTLTVAGGQAPFTYAITAPAGSVMNNGNNAVFNGLAAGTYTFQVNDANQCTITRNFTINPITPISVTGQTTNNATCLGYSDGSLVFTVSNAANYNYVITNGSGTTVQSANNYTSSTIALTGLDAGNYTVNIVDPVTHCTATVTVTIQAPPTALTVSSLTVNRITCISAGSATITATGGWGGYTYVLETPDGLSVGPQTSGIFNNLTVAGSYNIFILDANNCVAFDSFNLTLPTNPVATIAPSSDICFDANQASLTVNVTGGLAPYQYSLNGGSAQVSNTFANLAPGTHTIVVTDANGCTSTVSRTIQPELTATATVTKNLDCTSSPNAVVNLAVAGGLANYTYQVSLNGGAYGTAVAITGTTANYSIATAGTYRFRITDASGCTAETALITIAPLTQPAITSVTQTQPILCNDENTGSINVVVNTAVGVGPYTLSVVNTTTGVNYGTQTSGLAAGNYQISVTDSNSCVSSIQNITLTQPNAIAYTISTVDIVCSGGGTAMGEVSFNGLTGGTAPYTYNLTSNFGFNQTHTAPGGSYAFTGLTYGIYQAEIIDANGCSLVVDNIVIASPPNDLTIDVSALTSDCIVGGSAEITVSAAVLSGSYEFGILTTFTPPYLNPADYQTADAGTPETSTFTGLIPGVTYTFVVHDLVTNCYYFKEAEAPINTPSGITATIGQVNNVTCTGAADGNVTFTFNGYSAGATAVNYEIYQSLSNTPTGISGSSPVTGGSVTASLSPLAPGTYFVLFTEVGGANAGCTNTSPQFTVVQSTNMLEVAATVIKNDNCNTNAGQISATGQFGTAPYEYQAVTAGSTPVAGSWSSTNVFNLEGGSYDVYVRDAYNCVRFDNITLPTDPSPVITASVATQCNTAEGTFTINVERTQNGVGPYTYSLNGGAFQTQSAATFTYTNLTSGSYTIEVRDVNGCGNTVTVDIVAPVTATPVVAVEPSCANNDGEISVTPVGGSGNFQYELQNAAAVTLVTPQASATFANLSAGNYIVVLHDVTTGCTSSATASLAMPTPVTFSATKVDVSCNSGTDGSITITLPLSNDNPPYTYSIDNGVDPAITQANPVFTALSAGIYTITVTSGKNCINTQTITIAEPSALTAAATASPFVCDVNNTVSNSTITITVQNDGTGVPSGTAPYTYSLDNINYFTGNTFTVTDTGAAQTLTVWVKDNNNCLASASVTIDPLPVITAVATTQVTAITCTNDEDAQVTITGGSGDYTFELMPQGTQPAVAPGAGVFTADFTLTSPGSYTFRVTDNVTGCTMLTTPYTIAPFDTLDVTTTAANAVTCFGANDGSVTMNVTGYTGSYTYEIKDGATTVANGVGNTTVNPFTVTGLPAGNYHITVIATGTPFCSQDSSTFTVPSPANALMLSANETASVTCTDSQGEIVAIASGGWGTYEYELVNTTTSAVVQAYASNNVFTGLSGGSYTVSVRDGGNCIVTQTVTLVVPAPITVNITSSGSSVLCNGDSTATVTATGVTGGSGTYQYVLNIYEADGTTLIASSAAQSSPVFTGLGAGTYSITVIDGLSCDISTNNVVITEPDPVMGFLSVTTSLTCTAQAQLTVTATGGTAPYQYSADNVTFGSANVFNVTSGTYQYYVKDANGCTAAITNQVTIPSLATLELNLNLSNSHIYCNGEATASITSNASGGLGNYVYELRDSSNTIIAGPQANGTFADLAAGTYFIHVQSGDCEASSTAIIINEPSPLAVTSVENDILCFGDANGSIELYATGGTGTMQYAISPNLDQFVTSNVFTGLAPGLYDVVVQDQNGCYEVLQFTIDEPAPLIATLGIVQDELCLNAANGTITIDIVGGTGQYLASLDGVTFVNVVGNQHTFTNLSGDTFFQIHIEDTNGCNINPPIEYYMNPPVEIIPTVTVDPACAGNVPGNVVTVNVNAEVVADVQYSLDGVTYTASNTFNNLAPGNYTAYVMHTNGCVKTAEFTINTLSPVTATATVNSDVLCFGGNNGEIFVNATGGTGALQYAISPAFTYVSTNTFTGLTVGSYTIRVRDAIGCIVELTNVTVNEPTAVLAASVVAGNETCLNAHDGTVTITVTGGTAPYATSLDNITFNAGQLSYTGLAAGAYTVYVRDANNCSITPVNFNVAPGVNILPVATVTPNCTNNVPGNVVTVNVNPAVAAAVQYSLDGVTYAASNTFTNLAPGSYTAYVRHTNTCVATATFTINNLVPVTANAVVTSNVLCFAGNSGTISVNATGGTGTLEFAISPAFVYGTSNTFNNLVAGTYTIRVRDAIGCIVEQTGVTVTQPTAVLAASVVAGNETCLNAHDGTVTITVTGGTAPYATSLDNVTFNAGQMSYTGLAAGAYTVYVRDANNCSITPVNFNVAPGVNILPVATVTPNCINNVPGNVVTVNVNPAVAAAVQYSLDGVTYTASNTFTNLAPGSYTAYVRHTNTCVATATFTINNLVPVTANAVVTSNVLCFAGNSGTISVNATGGTGTLEFAISPAFVYGTSNTFNNLVAGTYTIRVRDAIGCIVEQTGVTVTQPTAVLAASVVAGNETCLNAHDGTVTITVTGGTAPYSTSLDNVTFNAGQLSYTGLAAGAYTVYVRDANNCSITPVNFNVAPGVNILPVATVTPNCTNNVPGNVVTVNVNPAVAAAVQYSLDGVTYAASNTFTNLAPGSYTAYVRHTNTCVATATFTINNLVPVTANAVVTSNVLCFAGNSGTISVNATGGTGTLEFAISPAFVYGTSNTFNNLVAGTYTIRVRDAIGCIVEQTGVTVTQPTAVLAASVVAGNETCLNAHDGTVTITVTGGTAPYATSLDNVTFNAGQMSYTGLAAGAYTVYVRDANNCSITPVNFNVAPGVNILPVATVTPNCTNNVPGNVVTVNVNPAVAAAVQYSLDGVTYAASNTFTNLAPGSYTAYVRHTNTCVATATFTINNLVPVTANAVVTSNVLCFGGNSGSISVNTTGGTGALQYAISPSFTFVSTNTFANLTAGTYTIRVRDAIGCEVQVSGVIVTEPASALTASVVTGNETCLNANDGTVAITITGGTAPYATSLDNVTFNAGQLAYTGLAAGNHILYVKDANSCEITPVNFTITPGVDIHPIADVVDNCTNNVPGNIVTISVNTDLAANVQYSLDGITYAASNTFNNLAPGSYTAYVQHANGCMVTTTFTIDSLIPVTANAVVTADVLCFGETTGTITVTATGGTGTIEYAISPAFVYGTSNTFNNLAAGTYTIRVRDAIGCIVEQTGVTVTQPALDLIATLNTTNEGCLGANDGTVTITVTGGVAPYSTSLDGGPYTQDLFNYTNLTVGSHTITVTDANGCDITPINFTIVSGVDFLASATVTPNCTNNVPGNIVTVTVGADFAPDVQYSLDGITYGASNTFTNLAPGSYTAYVLHANGCIQTDGFTINNLLPVTADAVVTANIDCFGGNTGTITVNTTGGTGTIEYAISPAFVYGTSNTFNNLTAGTYTIRVRDAIGCEVEETGVTITEPAASLTATVTTVDETCIDANDGAVKITISGGTAPYATSLDGVTFNNGVVDYSNLADGTYTAYVTDANGCTVTPVDFVILPGVDIQATTDVVDNCTSNVPGNVVTINVNPAVAANVQYSVDGVMYAASNTFNNLAPGSYTAYVQHANGCIDTEPFTIQNIVPVTANVVVTSDVICFGTATGVITVAAAGGTGTIEYAISPAFAYGTSNMFTGLTAGAYTIRVRDAIGCEVEFTNVIVGEPAAAVNATIVVGNETCIHANDGSVTITVTGGTAPYATSMNGTTWNAGQMTYTNLADGSYTLYVRDANNCTVNPITFTVTPGVDVQASVNVTQNCTNNVPGNIVTINVNPAVAANVQYSVDGVTYVASNTFNNLAPGSYTAYVQHANGCIDTEPFTIQNIVPVTANVVVTSDVICFGTATGVITVAAAGGTGTIEYAISPAFAYGTSNMFTGLTAGTYTIRVRDAIGCEVEFTNVIVGEPAAAVNATIVVGNETCINANDGSVTITVTGGTAPYATSMNGTTWNAGQMTYTNLADGSYTLYVRDANNCTVNPITFTVTPGVDVQASVNVTQNCTNNVPGNVVTINVNPAVAANVQYSVDGLTYAASNTFTNLAPGNYTAYVQHANGCIDTEPFTIQNIVPVTANVVVTSDVICFGTATGVITVAAAGGTGTIEYAISPAFAYGTSNMFTSLTAGTYTIRVRDAIGCEIEFTNVIVGEPATAVNATIVVGNETCINANDGSVTITVTGGTAPYATSMNGTTWNAGQMTYTNLVDGSYTLYVRDANNCTVNPITFNVTPGVDVQASVNVTQNCTSNVPGNVVTINVNPAVAANVQYSVDGTTYGASNTFNNLAPGSYTAYVQHANGCIDTEPFTIQNIVPVTANVVVTSDVICFGTATGVITVAAAGGTGTIEYAISPAFVYGTSNMFTGLTAGAYTIRVRDAIGCEVEFTNVIVGEPAAAVNATIVVGNETCINANDGSVTITVTGGTAPYATSMNGTTWNTGQMTYTNLADGSYTLYVRDANNCTVNPITFTVTPGVDVQASVNVTQNCTNNVPGNVVTINVNPAVAANVQYSVDGVTYVASNTFNNLAPGSYTAYVQHANGCIDTEPFTIQNIVPVTANAVVTSNVVCFGQASGVITVTATGGTGALEYAISPAYVYGTNNVFANLAAGTYTVRVRDAIGCELQFTNVIVTQPTAVLAATVVTGNETCINANNGSVTITVTGGTAPYATSINGTTWNAGQMTYTNLADGSYTVYVRDANNCTITPIPFTVTPGVDVQASVNVTQNCTNNVPGNVVTINVNPAVAANVQYSVDGVTYVASNTFNNLAPGSYTAYVKHANGCIDTEPFTIQNIVPVTANAVVTSNVVCFGQASGVITVTATGGTGALEYAISPAYVYGTNNVFANLAAGTYTVRVRDAIGCELQFTNVIVTQPTAVLAATVVTGNETCINANNGSVTITVTGGTAPYATSMNGTTWNAGQMTYTNLADGSYTVYVRDANNCTITPIPFTVTPGVDVQASVTVTPNCTNNVPGNIVTINVNPAVAANVQYSVNGTTYVATNTFPNLAPGNYTAYVKHANGCIDTEPFIIPNAQPIQATAVVTANVQCYGTNIGQIVVNATGGNGNIQYAISPAFAYTNSNVFNNLAAGTYTIKVKDNIGCEIQLPIVIVTGPNIPLTATISGTHETCLGQNDGTITISVTGGTAPYSTSLNTSNPNFFLPNVFSYENLTGGDLHLVYVRDANGCQIGPLFFNVQDGVELKPTVDVQLNCTGNTPGNVVTFTVAANLQSEVQYSLDGINYQDSNIFENLPPGNYTGYVRHINGCQVTVWFNIANRLPIVANTTSTAALCNGEANGTVTVAATGGTGELKYGISPDFNMSSQPTFTNLIAGTYTIRVEDAAGCFVMVNAVVNQPVAVIVDVVDVMQEICAGENDAAIEIAVSGGSAPYSTSLTANGNFVEDQYLFENLTGGQTYTIYVKDGNNCITTVEVPLAAPIDINAQAEVVYNCENNVVTIGVDVSARAGVTYSLDGGAPQASEVFTNLTNGNHTVTVVHAQGCTDEVTFNISNAPQLSVSLALTGFNEMTATATGGYGNYTYTFNGDYTGFDNVYVYGHSGTYIVTVTDSRGCTAQAAIAVTFTEITIPDVITPNEDGQNDTWGPGNTGKYPNMSTEIFDRYGRVIETLKPGQMWDGKYNGVEMPTGDYWYVIRLGDGSGKEFVGHFTIYR